MDSTHADKHSHVRPHRFWEQPGVNKQGDRLENNKSSGATCGSVGGMKLILESYWGLPSSTFIHLYVTSICIILVVCLILF